MFCDHLKNNSDGKSIFWKIVKNVDAETRVMH